MTKSDLKNDLKHLIKCGYMPLNVSTHKKVGHRPETLGYIPETVGHTPETVEKYEKISTLTFFPII